MLPTSAMTWLLAQTLWVGAHASYLLVLMPALRKVGFAPLLLTEVHSVVRPALLVLTLMAMLVQLLALWRTQPLRLWLGELRGRLLLVGVGLCVLLMAAPALQWLPEAGARLAYGALLGVGLVLLTQPLPQQPRPELP